MINDKLDIPEHWFGSYQGMVNSFLVKSLFNEMQRRKKGTFAWDFVRYLMGAEEQDEEKYMEQYKELFNVAFESEASCQEWIDTKIAPAIKETNYSITCALNDNKWEYKLVRPSKFRDYHNHKNVFVPCLIMADTESNQAAFATSAAFDAYDSYEDLIKIENFTGIIKGAVALTGAARYKQLMDKYKNSRTERIRTSRAKDSDGTVVAYNFNIPQINAINRKRFKELKEIKNNNVFSIPNTYDEYSGLQYAQPTVIASIKGSDYKRLFISLGTEDGKGEHTIHPDNSPFPKHQIYQDNHGEEMDVLLSPATILEHIKDDEIYWVELDGWTRYSVPLLLDGHYKKRWQSQFYFVNPDALIDRNLEWSVESIQKLTSKDKWMYHLSHDDKNLEFYSDNKGKSLDWWLKTYARIDKVSYDLSWEISAENWNTKKLKIKSNNKL